MYSTIPILKNSKTGKIVGTHQKLDRAARRSLPRILSTSVNFPSSKEIVYFEGSRGPDGLKRKSPGIDEPTHFIIPGDDDGNLIKIILDHQHNLKNALKKNDRVRAAFEAAWLAHAITDGLTPAHHFPLSDAADELMTKKEFVKIFGQPIKGIMHGETALETVRNNWRYWGAGGYMSKHVAFEYGVAITTAAIPYKTLTTKITIKDRKNLNLEQIFYKSLKKVSKLDMYNRFCKEGWTTEIASEVKRILLPEIIKVIALAWLSAIPDKLEEK